MYASSIEAELAAHRYARARGATHVVVRRPVRTDPNLSRAALIMTRETIAIRRLMNRRPPFTPPGRP